MHAMTRILAAAVMALAAFGAAPSHAADRAVVPVHLFTCSPVHAFDPLK